jgi:hypothetical protein
MVVILPNVDARQHTANADHAEAAEIAETAES